MKIILEGNPRNMFADFLYEKIKSQSTSSIQSEHGTFILQGRKYLIEFVRSLSENLSQSRWVVSKLSIFPKEPEHGFPMLIYYFKEEKMLGECRKRNAFPVIVDGVPMLAICDIFVGLVKVYEIDKLNESIPMVFGNEGVRFYPIAYGRAIQLKKELAIALEKKYVLLPYEKSEDRYEFFLDFFQKNRLAEMLA